MWLPPVLYFASDRNGTWDVFRRHSFTGETALYDGPSKDVAPSPAPDGIWVAFATNKDGNFEIYKRNTTTQELVRLTNNQTSDSRPVWFAYFF
jgi:Tol biopolymer transport system component